MAESHTESWGGLFTRLSIRLKPSVRRIDQARYPTDFRDSHLQKLQVFAGDLKFGVPRQSCDVAARTGKTRDVTLSHRVERYHHHDRDCRSSSFRRSDGGRIGSDEHINFETSQLGRKLLNLFWAVGPPVIDSDVLPLYITSLTEGCAEFVEACETVGRTRATAQHAKLRQLQWRWGFGGDRPGERPGERGRQEAGAVHAVYSITWSARASSDGGIVRPRALAVLRLMTNSY
jgi:hypothetical protein